MLRGEVHFLPIPLPNRDELGSADQELEHFVVVLRGSEPVEHNVPFVIATTNRRAVDFKARYEVHFDGHPFHRATIIDCRWVMTLPQWHFTDGTYQFTLSDDDMESVSIALVRGLQLDR